MRFEKKKKRAIALHLNTRELKTNMHERQHGLCFRDGSLKTSLSLSFVNGTTDNKRLRSWELTDDILSMVCLVAVQ